jgi:pilus assembly protein Flp/PilA
MFGAKIGARQGFARMVRNFLKDTSGATAIEYALIAAGISVVIVNAVNSLGIKVTGLFTKVDNALN